MLDELLAVGFHFVAHLLHLQVVFLLQVVSLALKFLPQLGLPLVVLCLEGKGVVLLAELLLLEGHVEGAHVGLECSFLDAVLILELLEGDLYVLAQFALLILVDEQYVLDPVWDSGYFCL